ncbi:hypothetical protein [Humibacillus xanthopallidus]|uniref:hypothetical protein n=1 Tax=Humibacillus xanthopallidus TaxID=412689 RepID=UPI00384B2D83
MDSREQERQVTPTGQDGQWLTKAWVGVALVPAFFFIAFAVGEWLYSMLGHQPGSGDAPLWVVLVTTVLILAVAVAPCLVAVHYGRRAVRAGDPRGRVPLVLAWLLAAGLVVLTVVSEVGNLVRQ